jgi:spore coat polysaccharide biosynthesis protein SpsF
MAPSNLNYPNLGLTLDENRDYLLIKKIFKKFKNKENSFSCLEIIDYLKRNKKLININKKVKRKKLPIKIK